MIRASSSGRRAAAPRRCPGRAAARLPQRPRRRSRAGATTARIRRRWALKASQPPTTAPLECFEVGHSDSVDTADQIALGKRLAAVRDLDVRDVAFRVDLFNDDASLAFELVAARERRRQVRKRQTEGVPQRLVSIGPELSTVGLSSPVVP